MGTHIYYDFTNSTFTIHSHLMVVADGPAFKMIIGIHDDA